jgi:hypothetical protein
MLTKSRNEAFEQLELFRPPPNRPRWHTLPQGVRGDVRELLAQMFRAYVQAGVEEDRKEVNDD